MNLFYYLYQNLFDNSNLLLMSKSNDGIKLHKFSI
jgi:hypothetical protein